MGDINKDILLKMLEGYSFHYVVVQTKFTTHHIERVSISAKDRGCFKWIAETDLDAFDKMSTDDDARRSHVDNADLFPRLYFRSDSMCNELFEWLRVRNLQVTDIRVPKI